MGEFGIGQPVPRTEDTRLLDGRGQYGDDFKLAKQCHGYILRSPHANAKKRIDQRKFCEVLARCFAGSYR